MSLSEGELLFPASRKRKFEAAPDASAILVGGWTTVAERTWAKRLKEAATKGKGKEGKDIDDPLSDLDYVQHAISTVGGSLEEALLKLKGMRTFLRKHAIANTSQDAMKRLEDFFDRYPEVLLRIDCCNKPKSSEEKAGYFCIVDLAALLRSSKEGAVSEQAGTTLLAGLFYMSQCLFPDIHAMRGGCTLIFECAAVNWDEDFDASDILRLWNELHRYYPFDFKDAWFYNTTDKGTRVLTLFGLQNLTEDTMQRIYLGCQLEVGGTLRRLNDLFSRTSPDEGNARIVFLREMEGLIETRYRNKEAFRL